MAIQSRVGCGWVETWWVREEFADVIEASPAWQAAVARARAAGRAGPDVLFVSGDAAFSPSQGPPGSAVSLGEWLRAELGAGRLMASTHPLVQAADGSGSVRAVSDEPVRSVLFTADGVSLFGPDVVEAVRVVELMETGEPVSATVPVQSGESPLRASPTCGRPRWMPALHHLTTTRNWLVCRVAKVSRRRQRMQVVGGVRWPWRIRRLQGLDPLSSFAVHADGRVRLSAGGAFVVVPANEWVLVGEGLWHAGTRSS